MSRAPMILHPPSSTLSAPSRPPSIIPRTLCGWKSRSRQGAVWAVRNCRRSPTFRTIFEELTKPMGAAFLVAVRQNEGLDVATVMDALQGHPALQVSIAQDGEALAPDHVYVCGPDDMMTIVDGHLHVRPSTEPVGHRGTIDTLLISLAEHAHERAVVVILSGLGSDGTAGVTATKRFGGLSIAELGSAQHQSINGAGPFGVVDLHLPADAIVGQIRRYVSSLEPAAEDEVPSDLEAHLTQITAVLRNVTGNDFHGYKRGTFTRRVQRRMQVLEIDTIEAYVERLRGDREEVQNLFQDLLIGVTQFFRDPAEFDALDAEMSRLFEGKGPQDHLRVWGGGGMRHGRGSLFHRNPLARTHGADGSPARSADLRH
ncbi:chemotaxis protein CheB [Paracoccus yeei]|uniref:chemotaxis protein CheB n=2 Tax=Paracoccus yeei TaxID=147645 RepID=UPI0039EF1F82